MNFYTSLKVVGVLLIASGQAIVNGSEQNRILTDDEMSLVTAGTVPSACTVQSTALCIGNVPPSDPNCALAGTACTPTKKYVPTQNAATYIYCYGIATLPATQTCSEVNPPCVIYDEYKCKKDIYNNCNWVLITAGITSGVKPFATGITCK